VLPYASKGWCTANNKRMIALRASGWGLLLCPGHNPDPLGFECYGIDNGAWSAHSTGKAWDPGLFCDLVAAVGWGAEIIVAPDIVEGGLQSLRLTERWLPLLDGIGRRRLVAVQDGMTVDDVRPLLSDRVGVFVGGSTPFKLATMATWAALARERDAYCHVGRVNSVKRIKMCQLAGVQSWDGTSTVQFPSTLRKLDNARKQTAWRM